MAQTHESYVLYSKRPCELSRDEALRGAQETALTPEVRFRRLEEDPPDQLLWHAFTDVIAIDPERAWDRWDRLKPQACNEYESGDRTVSL